MRLADTIKDELTLDGKAASCLVALRSAAARKRARKISDAVAETIIRSSFGDDAPVDFLQSLVNGQHVRKVKGGFTFPKQSADGYEDTPEGRFAQFVESVAQKALRTPEAQVRLAKITARIVRLHGVHSVDQPGLKGALIPVEMSISDGIPLLAKAVFLRMGARGVKIFDVPAKAVRVDWIDGRQWPNVYVNLRKCTLTDKTGRSLDGDRISGPDGGSAALFKIDRSANVAIRYVIEARQAIEAVVGEEFEGSQWKGFCASVTRGRRIADSVRMVLANHIDKGAMRVMRRNPRATFGDYFRFVGMAIKRREQIAAASESFPFYTERLLAPSRFGHKGVSLEDHIAKRTGFSLEQVERLRGLHWQSFGAAHRVFFSEDQDWELPIFFDGVDPDLMPKNRTDWELAGWCSRVYDGLLYYMVRDVQRAWKTAIAKDWKRAYALYKAGFERKIELATEHLSPLVDGRIESRNHYLKNVYEAVVIQVGGRAFDMEACEEFVRLWDEAAELRVRCLLDTFLEEGVTIDDLHEEQKTGDEMWDSALVNTDVTARFKTLLIAAYEECLGSDFVRQTPKQWDATREAAGEMFW
jgi:hypothetical protein